MAKILLVEDEANLTDTLAENLMEEGHEVIKAQDNHLKEMVAGGDEAHESALKDMQAAITAYPQLGNDPDRQLEVRKAWGISRHILNCEPATVAFIKDVLDELVDVFPFEMIHLGGDEVPPSGET